MYQFNHILLCLGSNREMDNALLAYVKLMIGCFPVKILDVLQVNTGHRKLDKPEVKALLSESGLNKAAAKINLVIKEGNPAKHILKYARNEMVDLIIIGRKKHDKEAMEMGKVVNSAHCSVLLIPEDPFTAIRKIVVAVDYSEHNLIGIKKALEIAAFFQASLIFAHVYHVPSGYHVSGKTYEEYAAIMEKNARVDADTFLKKHSLEEKDFRSSFILDDNNDPSDRLYRFAEDEGADLICISSTGLNAFTDIFFDSTAEMLFKRDNSIPLLVVKEKKESKGLLQVLQDL